MITTFTEAQVLELKSLQRKAHQQCKQNYLKVKTAEGTVIFIANENDEFLNSIAKEEPKKYTPNLPNRTA